MAYQFNIDVDPKVLDKFVLNSDQNNLFQCSPWASIKSNWGHVFTSVTDNNEVVGTALVLIRKLPLGKTLFYVPRGPVMDYKNKELVSFYINELKKLGKKRHAIVLTFDPCLLSRVYPYVDRNEEHPYQNNDVIEYIKSLGVKHRGFTVHLGESIQPRFNAEMDVTPDYKEVIPRKTFRFFGYAEHKGIEIYEGHEYLDDFAKTMRYTESRKNIALRNEEYFSNMLNVYGDKAICMVAKLNFPKQIKRLEEFIKTNEERLESEQLGKKQKADLKDSIESDKKELEKIKADYQREGVDEVVTSGLLAVYNEKLMEIFYMGNNANYLRTFSSYLLWSKCLDKCVEHNIVHCSFGGIEGTLDDGLTIFKSKWNMNVEEYIGEFNLVLDPFMYAMYDDVYPFMKKIAKKFRK